jgi:predicted dinucleotide-binding enzyme
MQIGILGTGNVARTLGRRWSAAGHEIPVVGLTLHRKRR